MSQFREMLTEVFYREAIPENSIFSLGGIRRQLESANTQCVIVFYIGCAEDFQSFEIGSSPISRSKDINSKESKKEHGKFNDNLLGGV